MPWGDHVNQVVREPRERCGNVGGEHLGSSGLHCNLVAALEVGELPKNPRWILWIPGVSIARLPWTGEDPGGIV